MSRALFHPRAVLSAATLVAALLGTACSDSTAPSTAAERAPDLKSPAPVPDSTMSDSAPVQASARRDVKPSFVLRTGGGGGPSNIALLPLTSGPYSATTAVHVYPSNHASCAGSADYYGWYVYTTMHFGQITNTRAYVKSITFTYYIPSAGQVLGGVAQMATHTNYLNIYADWARPYRRTSATNSYAGSYTVPVNKWVSGGGYNGRLQILSLKISTYGSTAAVLACTGWAETVFMRP